MASNDPKTPEPEQSLPYDNSPGITKPSPVLDDSGRPFRERLWTSRGAKVHLGIVLALATIALLTYANSFNAGFTLDSKELVLEDSRLQEVSKRNLRRIMSEDYGWPNATTGFYRPLTTLSYMLNYAVLDNMASPAGYHILNVLLHWATGFLVYLSVLLLMGNPWPAFFASAIFLVHPVTTETVTNIPGRAEILATMSVLGGWLLYARGAATHGWCKAPWLVLTSISITLGIFSGESAVVVIGVIVLYDFLFRVESLHANWMLNLVKHLWSFAWQGYVFLVPPLLICWHMRRNVFNETLPPVKNWFDNPLLMEGVTRWEQLMTVIKVIGQYLTLLVWPAKLSVDYSYNQVPLVNFAFEHWEDWQALLALLVIVFSVFVVLHQFRRNRALVFFVLFFYVALLPASSLTVPAEVMMTERFLYMPLFGFVGCLVVAVYSACRRAVLAMDLAAWAVPLWVQVAARSLLIIIILAFGVRSFARNFDWQDDVKLWSSAVQACPHSYKAHQSLAFAMYQLDPTKDNPNLDEIINHAEAAKGIVEDSPVTLLHLGAYYRLKGDQASHVAPDGSLRMTSESRNWYQKSVETLRLAIPLDEALGRSHFERQRSLGHPPSKIPDVGNHEIYWNLGLVEARLGRYEEALSAYLQMRHLAPINPDAYLNIASAHLARGSIEDAVISLTQMYLIDNSRQDTERLLCDLYRQIDREGCAVMMSGGELRRNPNCPLVQEHQCRAYIGLVDVFSRSKTWVLAKQARNQAVDRHRCNPVLLDQVMALPKNDSLPEDEAP